MDIVSTCPTKDEGPRENQLTSVKSINCINIHLPGSGLRFVVGKAACVPLVSFAHGHINPSIEERDHDCWSAPVQALFLNRLSFLSLTGAT